MPRYFIKLAYNGKNFHGWQRQPNAVTVQETLENALTLMLRQTVSLTGCGRTDAGVHAREFFAHLDLESPLTTLDRENLVSRLNRYLSNDTVLFWMKEVPGDLHARFSALSRTYRYYFHTRKDPFLNGISWFVHDVPDLDLMNAGSRMLLQVSDFTSFSKLHSNAGTNLCRLTESFWTRDGHRLIYTVTADRFLRNMVRAMVGTLVELGQGKMDLEGLRRIVDARDRSDAGQSVPAHGLFLEKIIYPVEFQN